LIVSVGMRGGIDSSYLVYVAKEVLGLRPLVFHVDAGWNSQIAVNNIERIVDHLKLDLYTEVIGGAASLDDLLNLMKEFGVISAAAGSLFVFKGKYKAVLINYPNKLEKKEVLKAGL